MGKECLRDGVVVGDDFVGIYDKGEEVVYWIEDEWIEDASLTLIIASTIKLFYTDGIDKIKDVLSRN